MADLPPTPKLATVSTPGGAKFSVAEEYAPRFQAFLNDLATTYNIDPATSGGYNRRYIAGTQTPSEHAYGRAVDMDWNANPQGGKAFQIDPKTARALSAKYGLTWGGDWQGSTADPMHFQINQQVAWDPTNGATPIAGGGTAYAANQNTNVTPGSPTASPNTNAPAATPTSSDIANAFQTHLAALQQQNQNLQLQQNIVGQQQRQLAFGLVPSPEQTFATGVANAFRGVTI